MEKESNSEAMEQSEDKKLEESSSEAKPAFKKPVLFGKIGRLPKKMDNKPSNAKTETETTQQTTDDGPEEISIKEVSQQQQIGSKLAYEEPVWGGLPESCSATYSLDVLKSGSILENINLMNKSYYTFGRFESCDIVMQHPTISRYHAVLQYRNSSEAGNGSGFYLYDLGSTHGTYLNKQRLKPQVYVKVSVGHMIKFGCSTRIYLLNGPEEDAEKESEFSVTELVQKKLKMRELEKLKQEQEHELKRKEEERGINWGMGDDADEETDLSENPYAQTTNEELYIDDPKKALRGFMEREGLELEYECREEGMGQYLCKVMLPLDDERGRPIYAEVLHKGKKKEAVVQCALEACKILDRYGVLRQATHESRKRKAKNWEENDYYDSDEDTYLDRTGTIEKKRANRMKAKGETEVETYQTLMEKEKSITATIKETEAQLSKAQRQASTKGKNEDNSEVDSLDSYMNDLKSDRYDKAMVSKLKATLLKLKADHGRVVKLINLAKPADLPPLVSQYAQEGGASKIMAIFGKRNKSKLKVVAGKSCNVDAKVELKDGIEEEEEKEVEMEEIEKGEDDKECRLKEHKETEQIKGDELEDEFISREQFKHKEREIKNKNNEADTKNNLEKLDDKTEVSSKDNEEEIDVKRAKKNQRRIQMRENKAQVEKVKAYQEDASKEDYNMWIPPENQSGDGRTNLNEKYGY